jgi:hypothetical protein
VRPTPFRSDDRGLLGPNGPLGPAFSEDLMRSLIAALPQEGLEGPNENDLCRWGGALTLLEAFQPRTPVEAMLAAQIIAAHHGIMECYFRATHDRLPEPLAIKLRNNVAALTRAQENNLRALERRQARPVPPPLPDVPTSLDWALDPEAEGPPAEVVPGTTGAGIEAAPTDAAAGTMARAAGSPAGAAEGTARSAPPPAASAGMPPNHLGKPPAATRPAIVIPQLEPIPPVDQALMDQMVAAARKEINDRLDRERGGTPQEWYARQREEVRQREAAARAAAEQAGKTSED